MKIIIVENDTVFSCLLVDHLREANHEVYLFDSIHLFGSSLGIMELDIIITDLSLGVSAGELIDFYRQFNCPIYVMSSIEEEDLHFFSSRIGAKGYFHKPFHTDKLISELNQLETLKNL
jgi:DNA-binding response OmpR family regulator